MPKFEVVIQTHAIYTVEADSYQDAEDCAWDLFDRGDLSEPICSEITKLEKQNA
jgi:hypothetical protein